MKLLVTGGAGYIGSVLVPELLQHGHRVRVLDNFTFGGESLLGAYDHRAFEVAPGEVRDRDLLRAVLSGVDGVIHLAAVVGDPACAQDPEAARRINLQATCDLIDLGRELGVNRFVFASTCSNYGVSDTTRLADETTPLNPVSLYAETKVAAEEYVMAAAGDRFCATVVRLATVFGLSPRMRFDLLVNEFVRDAVLDRKVVVYGPSSWRPFLHVRDAARAFVACLAAPEPLIRGQVFNVGCGNYRKMELLDLLSQNVPGLRVELAEGKADPRDYRVSFDKIQRLLRFETAYDLKTGIEKITDALARGVIRAPRSRVYRNVD